MIETWIVVFCYDLCSLVSRVVGEQSGTLRM
jgi:hypothetical protein